MSDAAAGVFISYRRQEASWLAAWLHDRLVTHFGEARVFLDIDWIKPGVDFMQVIAEAIARSRVLLVIIGPHWLAAEGDGCRRLDRPDDPIRVELDTAFRRGLRVIPLLLDGATMPRAGDLPDALAGLARLNALRVGYQSSRSDLARLIEALADELGFPPTPGLPTAKSAAGPGPEPRRTRSADRAAQVDVGRDEEQRARLLSRLSRTYTEYLDQSVEHDAILKLQLGLDRLPGKTFRPQDRLLPAPHQQPERLSAGTSLLQAFDEAGGLDGDGLLILGEPGAGKTTLLFELARQLTERAHTDLQHPVPVYLPLSSWATRRPRLDQWLVEQLNELYQIPRPLARRWTSGTQLLFVLDGLDEIPSRDDRLACVKAINQFTRFGRFARLPVVVASRPVEYDTLPVQLQLETAIGVRPLEPTVVLDALEHAPGMQAVAVAVRGDPELRELLRSPLLGSMLTLTYAGTPEAQIHATPGDPAQRRQQLITDYVNRRFELDRLANGSNGRQGCDLLYPPERTSAWLSALALYLTRHQQTIFLLGRLQPDWLPAQWARAMVVGTPGLIGGLIFGLILGVGTLGSGVGLGVGLKSGLDQALIVGLGASLGAGLVSQSQPAERLSWSWGRARARLPSALAVGLIFGLISGLTFGLAFGGLSIEPGPEVIIDVGTNSEVIIELRTSSGVSAGLSDGLAAGFSIWVGGGLSRVSAGLRAGLAAGLIVGLVFGLFALGEGLSVGLAAGVSAGLGAGLGAGLAGQPQAAERLSWSWGRARARLPSALAVGLIFGLSFELITGRLDSGLGGGLLVGLSAGLAGGLNKNQIPTYVTPNEGIRKSIRNGLIVALISGLAVGFITNPAIVRHSVGPFIDGGADAGVLVGLLVGLFGGLGAAAQHGVFRLLLWRWRIAPLRYVRWLNYAVRLRLLYRSTSGGYVFIHRIVQDYFCDRSSITSQDSLQSQR